jgi:PTS system mannose-specific IIC component
MSFLQALICGLFYYLNAGPWVFGIGFYTFGRPVVVGFFVGLVLGDPITGAIVGASIQMIYLGLMSTGGSYPADAALAGIIGTAVAIQTGMSPQEAVAIAVPIGLVGTIFFQIRMVIGVFWTHVADKFAAQGKTNLIFYANVLFPSICIGLLYVIPCTLALYFGVDAVRGLVTLFEGSRVMAIIGVIGGMLPALGIAMNMKAIFKGDARLFFFIGFLMVIYFKLNLIAIGCFAVVMAIIYMQLKKDNKEETAQ